MAGVDPLTIQQLGGRKMLQMVQRYAHLSPDHTRHAIERLQAPVRQTDILTAKAGQVSAAMA